MSEQQVHSIVVEKLSTLINRKGNHLDGWFDETVEKLTDGEVVENVCIDGEWVQLKLENNELVTV